MHRIGPACAIRLSFVQVDLSFERSSSSHLARRKIDNGERHHRKCSSSPREPTCSVHDRRNFRKPGSIWRYEDTLTNKRTRQLVAVRRGEGEGPGRRTVGIYLSCDRSREPTEVGRSTLGSPSGRRRRNVDNVSEGPGEGQLRATLRLCLSQPQTRARGRRW